MTIEEVRIECLKIAHSHGLQTEQVVERAQAFEAFVMGGPAKAAPWRQILSLPKKAEKGAPQERPG